MDDINDDIDDIQSSEFLKDKANLEEDTSNKVLKKRQQSVAIAALF